jgi:hypothetical protein
MTLVVNKPKPVKLGDVADLAARVDRLGNVEAIVARVEKKLDGLIAMMEPLFGNPSVRQGIGASITTHSMRALRK